MKYSAPSRRHFLQGLGVSMALPLLPSLMPKAHAQAMRLPKFFATTWIPHGGLSEENAYPLDATVTLQSTQLYAAAGAIPAHMIRHGRLVDMKRTHASTASVRRQVLPDLDNGLARFSPLMGSFLTDTLLNKINVLRGIDMMDWGGHTRGYLGNYVNRDGGAGDGRLADVKIPTIDYVISQSPNFYTAGERLLTKAPSLNVGGTELSTYRMSTTVAANPFRASRLSDVFQMLFSGVATTPGQVDPKVKLVDRVRDDYRRMVSQASASGRRISLDDKARLGEYLQSVEDMGNRMRAMVSASCVVPTITPAQGALSSRDGEFDWEWGTGAPTTLTASEAEAKQYLSTLNMLLVAAFQCGATRMFIRRLASLRQQWDPLYFPDMVTSGRSDSHDMVFHGHAKPERQRLIAENQRFQFENAYVDLVKRMDSTQIVPGVSMLDQSLVYWGSECGFNTHDAKSLPAVLAGGAGGFFNTGNYVDYTARNRTIRAQYGNMWTAGVPQNRLLANIAQSMGLTPNEYELDDTAYATKFPNRAGKVPGYGDPAIDQFDAPGPYTPQQLQDMSLKLPIVTV